MTRIVNVSDKPYEFCFDACVYGPYQPGAIIDLPDEVAVHGVHRSQVLDEIGNTVGFRCEFFSELKGDEKRMQDILVYDCPLALSDQCNAPKFKNLDDLRAHMETHWAQKPPASPVEDDGLSSISTSSRSKQR